MDGRTLALYRTTASKKDVRRGSEIVIEKGMFFERREGPGSLEIILAL